VPAKTRSAKPRAGKARTGKPAADKAGWRLFGRRKRPDFGSMDFAFDAQAPDQGPAGPQYETLGEELKAARQERGLTLDELAETTRVRRAYLEALEEMRLEALPSRPFTIGYIKAYAEALGLPADSAVERFKAEEPVLDEPLPNPVGVIEDKDPRIAAFIVGGIVIIAAIMTWNIAQHSMIAAGPPPTKASDERAFKVLASAKAGAIELGKPLPAPVESTIPPPYETPGLAEALGLKTEGETSAAAKAADDPLAAAAALPATFTPAGQVYGAGGSSVTVQALKPGLLIARGADGSVYFARQLAKGEAYRVPALAGLTLDVSSPKDFQVFVGGQSKGLLPAQQVLAAKLVGPAPSAPVAQTAPSAAAAAKPAAAKTPSSPPA
jgi:transcriptional regulator with XRE-family HTH domain